MRLTNESKNRRSTVTAILSKGDFFGAQCLIGFPLRLSTAVTMTGSLIRSIPKQRMIDLLRTKNKISIVLVSYLLSTLKKYQEHVAALLTFTAEQRLARILLTLAHLDRKGPPITEVPNPNQQVLADMVGTTRSHFDSFYDTFLKAAYISYDEAGWKCTSLCGSAKSPREDFGQVLHRPIETTRLLKTWLPPLSNRARSRLRVGEQY